MALARTPKGTGSAKDLGGLTGSVTMVSGVTIAAGACVKVGFGVRGEAFPDGSITWNGHALVRVKTEVRGGGPAAEDWQLDNAPGGTGDLVFDCSSFETGPSAIAAYITEVTGAPTSSASDRTVSANGSSTSPSSGATAALSQNDEIAFGTIATAGPNGDTAGSWSNGFTNGQRLGTTGGSSDVTVSEGYKIVADGAAQTAAKTGITSRAWSAICSTIKQATAVAPRSRALLMGVG